MSGEGKYDFTDTQLEVLNRLPDTRENIANDLGISRRAVRGRMNQIEEQGGSFTRDSDFVWHWAGEMALEDVLDVVEKEEKEDFDTSELTEREQYLLQNVLPASTEEIADELRVPNRIAETHIEELQERGAPIKHDEQNDAWFINDPQVKRKIGSRHMGTITRKANDWLAATEDAQIRQARSIEPVIAVQEPTEGNEDIVAALSDLHVGQDVEDETGEVIYGEDEWRETVRHFTAKCLEIPERMLSPHIEFDTFHLLLNGDICTNENIYEHQPEDIGAYLADQIDIAVEELVQLVITLAERYEKVNVVCQVGNHGQMRATGQTRDANADLFVYRELKRVLHYSDYDNVNFQVGDATAYKTFELRGGKWYAFATHGEAAYEQITGTAASDAQMRNWLNGLPRPPDVMYLGHYHEYRYAPVDGIPAIRFPSPKPGGMHEFEIGVMEARNAQPKLGYIHGVSDDRPITWQAVIDTVDSKNLF